MTSFSITRYSGIDYGWQQIAEKRTQREALLLCDSMNKKKPYLHRVEVMRSVELPKFTKIKPSKNDDVIITIPSSFTIQRKRNLFQKLLGVFF